MMYEVKEGFDKTSVNHVDEAGGQQEQWKASSLHFPVEGCNFHKIWACTNNEYERTSCHDLILQCNHVYLRHMVSFGVVMW